MYDVIDDGVPPTIIAVEPGSYGRFAGAQVHAVCGSEPPEVLRCQGLDAGTSFCCEASSGESKNEKGEKDRQTDINDLPMTQQLNTKNMNKDARKQQRSNTAARQIGCCVVLLDAASASFAAAVECVLHPHKKSGTVVTTVIRFSQWTTTGLFITVEDHCATGLFFTVEDHCATGLFFTVEDYRATK